MRHLTTLLVAALCLGAATPLAAQSSVAFSAAPNSEAVERGEAADGLRDAYAVRLVSDWPQLSEAGTGCVNGGQEVLAGTLSRSGDGGFAGQLERHATILFCGVHGVARSACALTLVSRGGVEATAEVLPEAPGGATRLVEMRWVAVEGADDVVIEGDCSPAFNDSLRRLYLGVTHALEFPLPGAGEGRLTRRLEDYGWIIDIR